MARRLGEPDRRIAVGGAAFDDRLRLQILDQDVQQPTGAAADGEQEIVLILQRVVDADFAHIGDLGLLAGLVGGENVGNGAIHVSSCAVRCRWRGGRSAPDPACP